MPEFFFGLARIFLGFCPKFSWDLPEIYEPIAQNGPISVFEIDQIAHPRCWFNFILLHKLNFGQNSIKFRAPIRATGQKIWATNSTPRPDATLGFAGDGGARLRWEGKRERRLAWPNGGGRR